MCVGVLFYKMDMIMKQLAKTLNTYIWCLKKNIVNPIKAEGAPVHEIKCEIFEQMFQDYIQTFQQ